MTSPTDTDLPQNAHAGDAKGSWIGSSVLRKEDSRHLRASGRFVADIRIPGLQDVAFLRSPMAHARLLGVTAPEGAEDRVFALADLGPLNDLPAGPELDAFRMAPYPPLAGDKVRYVGQPIAACIGKDRASAEDIAEETIPDLEELGCVVDAVAALAPDAPRLHDDWPDNAFIRAPIRAGETDALANAPVRVTRSLRMSRQATVSLEGRGVVAYWDNRAEELVVHLSTQGPHVMRHGLAQVLELRESQIRVIAPDVGGGFGGKNRLTPEEVAVAALALRLKRPLRWIEDRNEHLLASVHAREHIYDLTLCGDTDGRLIGISGSLHVDAGAYALWPTGAFMEASMAARNLTGPYRMQALDIETFTVATNKPPMGPYRGVARPGACFAIERMVDEFAQEIGQDPIEVRRRNLLTSEELPHKTQGGMTLDSGDYPAALEKALSMIDVPALRRRQKEGEPDGRRIGLGVAIYTEQSGHGTAEWTKRKARVVPGFESATLRAHSDGSVDLFVGILNHGQGLETTLAQIAATELGLDPAEITVRHGDTGISPFGFGTFASRSIVFSGGAVAKAARTVAAKARRIAGHLLQVSPDTVTLQGGLLCAGNASIPFAEVARAATVRPEFLPLGEPPLLEATETYEPADSSGVFSYGAHAVAIAVEPETGAVEILDYVVAEDCGVIINPMIVDGQILGGVAQGLGTALFEELVYDPETGQPLATTFGDYMVACAPEIPDIRIAHLMTPAAVTEYGVRGMGEGRAIAPPAVIGNALSDAFAGATFLETPFTPRRVSNAIAATPDGAGS
ncbi:xanthine dehydrogenase family protein molybdopterin-binding subunit [Roseisalinus antarcticus]|uniref:Caffeine dehydrogenase subunit alpha n=1 Tax=Roseisalinus antarcticus TaxID=254357 RepID=A0A1Y5TWP3_9RHOB|nr:xanthine dehydrogenase family protein molybdopterin-binding subunit [Roseisalinus antarcticus]SLN75549.1 Caffeine dehydrogenase subunit alpha [Roseisalinus antarcticus]